MARDGIAGVIFTILFGLVVALVGRDWVVAAFASDPLAAVCFTLCALALGYLACSLVHAGRQADVDGLADEVERLRCKYADERAYTAALLVKLPPGERMTREEVVAMIEGATGYDDEADAAKLGATVEQVRSLGETARRVLHEMGGLDAAALRDYCSKCVHVAWDGGNRPTWPCNSPGGVPGERFPNLAISTDHLDRLVALGLVSATARIPIGPSGATRMFMRGREYRVTSLSMMTLKTTGEQTVSAFLFPLTGSGVELAALCGAGIGEQGAREVVSYLTSNRMKVEMMVS